MLLWVVSPTDVTYFDTYNLEIATYDNVSLCTWTRLRALQGDRILFFQVRRVRPLCLLRAVKAKELKCRN